MKEKGLIPAADPVNRIACRSRYGSANPAAILGPAILATAVSTAVEVFSCRATEKEKITDRDPRWARKGLDGNIKKP